MEKNTVLIIEDEEKTGAILKEALESENIEVTWKVNGQEALEVMEAGRFDLIILDLKMPGMTGDKVLQEIRRIDRYVEVIVYTNYQNPPQMKNLINLGVDAFIDKGASANLWETVDKVKTMLNPISEEERDTLFVNMPKDPSQQGY